MTYEDAAGYMNELQKKGSILGLLPVTDLLERIGNPQDRLSVIHVAGTNGKGSICAFLERMYLAEGKRVGRYLSPTMHSYLERFQVNGERMPEEEFAGILADVLPHIQDMEREGKATPTAFEVETVIAFLYFVKTQVDIVILETGMGGRIDATNVVKHPLCTVFASIGMDHMQFLGDTLEKITLEKAGIMKEGCPAVSYPNRDVVVEVLKEQGSLHHIKDLKIVREEDIQIIEETLEGSRFLYKGEEYCISLGGSYQIYNAVTAIETKCMLDGRIVKSALLDVKWEGRFEVVDRHPLLIRDGAHNIDGVSVLRESVEKHFTNRHLIFIIGVLKDKDYRNMMRILCPLASKVFTITPKGERGLSAGMLADVVRPYCHDVIACENVTKALEAARESACAYENQGIKTVIVAWGSLSYIGEIHGKAG